MTVSKKNSMPKLKPSKPTKKTAGVNYRGVSLNLYSTKNGEWKICSYRSRINNSYGMEEYLGSFKTPEAAAKAYNKRAKALFGEKKAKSQGRWNHL